jgi:hypothetical protein
LKVVPRHALQDAGDDLELSARLLAVHLPGKAAQSFKRLFGGDFVGPNVHQEHPPSEGAHPLLCQVVRELRTPYGFLRVPSVHRFRHDPGVPEQPELVPGGGIALLVQTSEQSGLGKHPIAAYLGVTTLQGILASAAQNVNPFEFSGGRPGGVA